jgi:hypothetical protein
MAKKLSHARGTTVSAMFRKLSHPMAAQNAATLDKIGPITRPLTGIAQTPRGKSNRQLIKDAIAQRHGS